MITPLPQTMRAWVVTGYGGPDVLALADMPIPKVGPADVLIKVQATTVSSADRRIRAMDLPPGMGLLGRAILGLVRPRRPVLGTELTGIVVAAGRDVTRFHPGDAVIAFPGAKMGGHAEFCRMSETGLIVPRPAGMALDTAAALGFGGTTALHYLRKANLAAGERMLVIGATGTVGSALVQLAAHAGAKVTAVTSGGNLDLARHLGAMEAIDYMTRDVTTQAARWDIVADAVAALSFARALPILAEGGRYLAIAGGISDMLARPKGSRRTIAGPAAERLDDLVSLTAMAAKGTFRPLVDSVVPFEQLPRAHARADTHRKRGSVIVRLDDRAGHDAWTSSVS